MYSWRPTRRELLKGVAGVAAISTSLIRGAVAAGYPDRNIKVIIPTREGGGADRNFRAFSGIWKNYLNKPTKKPYAGCSRAIRCWWTSFPPPRLFPHWANKQSFTLDHQSTWITCTSNFSNSSENFSNPKLITLRGPFGSATGFIDGVPLNGARHAKRILHTRYSPREGWIGAGVVRVPLL